MLLRSYARKYEKADRPRYGLHFTAKLLRCGTQLRLIKMFAAVGFAAVAVFLVVMVDPFSQSFKSGARLPAAKLEFHDQLSRRLRGDLLHEGSATHWAVRRSPEARIAMGANQGVRHSTDSRTGIEANETITLFVHGNHVDTSDLSRQTLLARNIMFGGGVAWASVILLIIGALAAAYKKGTVKMYYLQWAGCCACPPCRIRYKEYSVLSSTPEKNRRRARSFYSPMPPLAGRQYLELQTKISNLSDAVRNALQSIMSESQTESNEPKEGNLHASNTFDNNAQMLLRMKNVGVKDRAVLEERLLRLKGRRKSFLALLFLAYAGICIALPLKAKDEVSCAHGFFWETHFPFIGTFFVSKAAELLIYTFDASLDGELGLMQFLCLFLPSFFGYSDGYRDAMAVQIADACANSDNPDFNAPLAATLHTTMYYSYYGGVVLLQWLIFGLLGIAIDPSSIILAKLLHMDALAACITVPPEYMFVWYGVNAAITIGENIPQGVQQMIFVRKVKQHLFLTIAITFSVISSIKALIDGLTRLAEAFGYLEAASRQAKTNAVADHVWVSALEGYYKGHDGCQGIHRTVDWSSGLILHNRGTLQDFYEVKGARLGEGSFGTVTTGSHLDSGVVRAIKSLDKGGQEPEQISIEIEIMKELDHPNIIKLHETFHDKNNVYLVMEICEGGELFDAILRSKTGFEEEQAAFVMLQAAKGVHYIHSCQICHRDIKPENFLLKSRGPVGETTSIKMIDFGTARGFEVSEVLRSKVGSPYYMAPEVLNENYTQLCDCWSLGIMLFAMLSCRIPFDGANEPIIHREILKGELKFEGERWNEVVSDSARSLIESLVTRQPKRLSAAAILEHQWIKQKGPQNKIENMARSATAVSSGLLRKLQTFGKYNELKKQALMVIARNLPERQLRSRIETFEALDTDQDGTISLKELENCLGRKAGDVKSVLQGVDVDGNGKIDFTEFLAANLHWKELRATSCWEAYQIFDRNGNGGIRADELRMILRRGFLKDDDQDIAAVMKDFDLDMNGAIDFVEFLPMVNPVDQDD